MSNNKMQTKHDGKDEHMDTAEEELQSFYEYCKENGLTDEEIQNLCKPLSAIIKKQKLMHYAKIAIVLAATVLTVYGLSYLEFVAWNVSAIGRIIMIKFLPYWDWTPLRKERCLIPQFSLGESAVEQKPLFDCILCESLDAIPLETNINAEFLNEHYLTLHRPAIITDGLRNWPSSTSPNYNLTEKILKNAAISSSYPCLQLTNVMATSSNVGKILSAVEKFDKYFAHFLNCDFNVVKEFRLFAPRPYFLPAEISPVQYSWILISRNYESTKFKGIELREKTTVFGQISGSNTVKLTPRIPCDVECPTLHAEMQAGEALVFTSLWNLEYKPDPTNKNFAVILESI